MTASVEWSSPYYDYMLIGDEKYEPVNKDGNSVFEIPVDGFDYPMEVVADTVAMSTPHEIEYTLQFDSASIKEAEKIKIEKKLRMFLCAALTASMMATAPALVRRLKKRDNRNNRKQCCQTGSGWLKI